MITLCSPSPWVNPQFMAVYVDDILVTGNNDAKIQSLKAFLHSTFQIKDLGLLNDFLGMEILHYFDGLIMTQRKFLSDFDTANIAVTHTPLPTHLQLKAQEGDYLPYITISSISW